MIPISDSERRRAFSIWLRTGRLPSVIVADGVELKFNPWHDPADGRFTFAGSGPSYGQSGSGGGGGSFGGGGASLHEEWSRESRSGIKGQRPHPAPTPKGKSSPPPLRPSLPKTNAQRPISQDGSGGGAGASSTEPWSVDSAARRAAFAAHEAATTRQPPITPKTTPHNPNAATPLRREMRGSYEYQIDQRGRTRKVSGALTLSGTQVRSRTAQAQAGGADRRPTDDGGHSIAARFNGPTDAFNHFAQDANFNRGRYRALEDEWAKAKQSGKRVAVKIVPSYDGISKRPAVIDISFTINAHEESVKLANEPKGKHRGE